MTAPSPAEPTLLFIPDISGFTRFVNETEIKHSQHIVEELLEAIIDSNEIGLVVSEIEGDAVLFYRTGPAPTAAELLAQVQRMYVSFHAHLRRYETHRICHCGACATASGLTLKFIAHYGEVGVNRVKDHAKLFGRDVIVAHRLMKNDVLCDEYALLTVDLTKACATWVEVQQAAWADPVEGEATYDSGHIAFCHFPLDTLRAQVPEPTIADHHLPGTPVKAAECEAVIEAPIDLVFDVISDLSSRHVWQASVKASDRLNHKIPQHGATHRCIIDDNERDPFVVSHDFKAGEDYITFTDTERRQGMSTVFTLRRVGPGTTRVQSHLFLKNALMNLVYRLFMKRKVDDFLTTSLQRLNAYCKELVRDGRAHPNRIVLRPASA